MILLIDIGNTRIKWAVLEGEAWQVEGFLLPHQISELSSIWQQLKRPEKIFASNVASDEIAYQLDKIAQNCFSQSIQWLTVSKTCCGVTHYCEPEGIEGKITLGTDRWAALIAAHHLYPGHKVVVGVGTAMVVEALTAEGEFIGGLILPGIAALESVLKATTARVFFESGQYRDFPTNTGDAVYTGIITALSSTVNAMVKRLALHCHVEEKTITGIINGGDAKKVLPYLELPFQAVDNLVLEGLRIIAQDDVTVWRPLVQSAGE